MTRGIISLVSALALLGCAREEPIPAAKTTGARCLMPSAGKPEAAAAAAISRHDFRLMIYWQNGEGAHTVSPGVKPTGPAFSRFVRDHYKEDDKGGSLCARPITVAIDRARSPGCCDVPETLDACGDTQAAFAEAYNIALIASPEFVAACGKYDIARGLRS